MKLTKLFLLMAAILLPCTSNAQMVSAEANRLAKAIVDWEMTEATRPTLLRGMQVQFREMGATNNASQLLVEEIDKAFTYENVVAATEAVLMKSFSASELAALDEVIQTPAGKRYLRIYKNPNSTSGILAMACAAVTRQLNDRDLSSIRRFCQN